MRLLPSDPDVETIVSRINSGDIDLQPDFQRGEVWGKPKKQKLIDSILRDWHVPPIHVIENSKTKKQEVLDGQQRLASIRDFVQGMFAVDGNTDPLDPAIEALDGKYYRNLPEEWRRKFNHFTIRVFRIVDYKPSEPAELFFRLNQPASLTGAEQRNAFFGPVREQIKNLVEFLEGKEFSKNVLAFSNLRMAYDDVLARSALAIERMSLDQKITSADLTALYRKDAPLNSLTMGLLERCIDRLAVASDGKRGQLPKFNKATLFSWLIFLARADLYSTSPGRDDLRDFLAYFETARNAAVHDRDSGTQLVAGVAPAGRLFAIYETRASARVADVSSVLLRDAILWLVFAEFRPKARVPQGDLLQRAFRHRQHLLEDDLVARKLIESGWGKLS